MINNKNIFFMKDGNDKINIKSYLYNNILKQNIIKNDVYNDILFKSVTVNLCNTNYNNCIPYSEDNSGNSISNYEMIKNNLLLKNTEINENSFFNLNEAYFIYTANCGHLLTHNIYDIFPQLNFFYHKAKKNPDNSFIIEIICKNPEGKNISYKNNLECDKNINNIKKIIQYFRDLNLNNPIVIISNKTFIQFYLNKYETINNIKTWLGNLYVKNLNVLNLHNKNIDYIPLLCRYVPNLEYNEVFNTTLYKFFKQIYIQNTKKNFILEKRIRNFKGEGRGFLIQDYNLIYNFCENYCKINNLNLIIWNDNYTNKSILEQQLTCYNADIIISIGGSFNLFNLGHSCSRIVILEFWPIINKHWAILSWLNIFSNHCSNDSKVYLYIPYLITGKFNMPVAVNYINIIKNIFNDNIQDYIIK